MTALTSYQGIAVLGTYTGDIDSDITALKALIPDVDTDSSSGAKAGGGFLDQMSPACAVQLRVELDAIAGDGGSAAASGSYTVLAADATAGLVDIDTGLDDITLANCAVSVFRAGSLVTGDAVITENSAGVLRVADGASTYTTTEDDVINWFARV